MEATLQNLQHLIGYRFTTTADALQALTHPSYDHEQAAGGSGDYQRLEFLGDSILGMLLAEALYHRFGNANEGDLSRCRAQLADQDSLAGVARRCGLGPLIRLGRGERQSSGSDKDSILADVLEAVIAAVYLDGGFEAARQLIQRLFGEQLADPQLLMQSVDAKSELQELLSVRQLPPPEYHAAGETGPPHDRSFCFQVVVAGRVVGTGEGRSKKTAQQSAARQALLHVVNTSDHQQ